MYSFFVADSLAQALCTLHCPFLIKSVTHTFATHILMPSRNRVKYANCHVCPKSIHTCSTHLTQSAPDVTCVNLEQMEIPECI